MSKYNLSCTIQNQQHTAIFGFLEIFFRGQNKNKNATGKIEHRQQQCKVLKLCFKKNLQKLIEV